MATSIQEHKLVPYATNFVEHALENQIIALPVQLEAIDIFSTASAFVIMATTMMVIT